MRGFPDPFGFVRNLNKIAQTDAAYWIGYHNFWGKVSTNPFNQFLSDGVTVNHQWTGWSAGYAYGQQAWQKGGGQPF